VVVNTPYHEKHPRQINGTIAQAAFKVLSAPVIVPS